MAAQPKRKLSKGRRNRRRSQDSLSKPALSSCPKCGSPKRAHFQCEVCGYYGGEKAVSASAKGTTKKAASKSKAK